MSKPEFTSGLSASLWEYGTGAVRLKNGENVYLAREKYSKFAKTYTKYLKTV